IIIPEISFLTIEGKHILKLSIYKGNNPPYHFKHKSIAESTYIRVGSSNKLANSEIIQGFERLKYNISFDSEVNVHYTINSSDISEFSDFFFSITGEILNFNILKKFELIKLSQEHFFPTNAYLLLANNS